MAVILKVAQLYYYTNLAVHNCRPCMYVWPYNLHAVCFRPDGRIDLKSEVPKEPMPWVIGALSMSRDKGLGIVTEPARVCTSFTQCSLGLFQELFSGVGWVEATLFYPWGGGVVGKTYPEGGGPICLGEQTFVYTLVLSRRSNMSGEWEVFRIKVVLRMEACSHTRG